MGLAFCLIAFVGALLLSRKSLGRGLGFVLAVGCLYGWLRANFLDGLTHFVFDAAIAGLYLGTFPRLNWRKGGSSSWLLRWPALLIGWPLIVILLAPFLDTQHVLIQLVGLRTAVLFVPLLIVGAAASREDFNICGAWAEWCVIVVSAFAIGELSLGLESFFPVNAATQLIYISNDIAGGFYRIPASFLSAHAYGGTMVVLLPLLLNRLEEGPGRTVLSIVAIGLASLGVFVCGARLPVGIFAGFVAVAMMGTRRRPMALLVLFAIMAAVGYTVSQSDRLRRYETLADTEMVEERVRGSVNMGFWEIVSEYPMGKGLGSAVGTSIPFFLTDYARPQIGIENEFGRLLLEEGLPGLALWGVFIALVLGRSARLLVRTYAVRGIWIVCAGFWMTGMIGAGVLASVPSTMILMLYMGHLGRCVSAAERERQGPRPVKSGMAELISMPSQL